MPSVNMKKNGQWVGQPVLGFKVGEDNLTDELKEKIGKASEVDLSEYVTIEEAENLAEQTLSEAKTFANQRIVYNYLDNSDFSNPVNQRDQTSYTAAGYTIDRWINSTKYGTINVLSGYISKLGTGSLFQHIEGLDPTKTYTGAVCLGDGTINVQSGILASTIGSSSKGVTISYNTDTGIATFFIGIDTTSGTNYKWAALYEGEYTAETLPPYIPKGYGAELIECQRYYQKLDGGFIPLINNANTIGSYLYRLSVNYPVTMRIVPTITVGEPNDSSYKKPSAIAYIKSCLLHYNGSTTNDIVQCKSIELNADL